MITILVDHNIEGHAVIIWGALAADGWLDLLSIKLLTFEEAGLPADSNDRTVWRFAQKNKMFLLTDNRNMKGSDSLEQTIRQENTPISLPVLTLGNTDRLDEKMYRDNFVNRLIDILLDSDNYLGTGRIFIP